MAGTKTRVLMIADIICDKRLQMREEGTDAEHAEDLAASVMSHQKLPPIKAVEIDGKYYLTDGFHTLEAHKKAARSKIECRVRKGDWNDAILAAAAANKEHLAKKRTRADKERAVRALCDQLATTGEQWSVKRIAEHVGVSHDFASRYAKAADAAKPYKADPKPKKDRVEAAERREAKAASVPSIEETPAGQYTPVPKLKTGDPVPEFSDLEAGIGRVIRLVDDLGLKGTTEHLGAMRLLDELATLVANWKKAKKVAK